MFGGGERDKASLSKEMKPENDVENDCKPSHELSPDSAPISIKSPGQMAGTEKRNGKADDGSGVSCSSLSGNSGNPSDTGVAAEKKRRSSGVSGRASSLLASAMNTLNFSQGGRSNSDVNAQTPIQKLGKQDPALAVPQGQHNNSAGESLPGPRSTFRVGVWEDRNKKCRRTMEDTHAFLYNFLSTPAPAMRPGLAGSDKSVTAAAVNPGDESSDSTTSEMSQSDNGYFAIFDGHAGTFAADWCGKKLHIILEDVIRRFPNDPIPELLDIAFTQADQQLENLPVKNSGCTAAIAVLRWEDRVPSRRSATGSQPLAPAAVAAAKAANSDDDAKVKRESPTATGTEPSASASEVATTKLRASATRQRVLYTANVGDARIILCRSGKALRLSYDHKGSDQNEGRRISNAGGLILNNRVNGVLAVTRALGDTYMKDLVTGHPYTTETVIQPDSDEFIIIACDGLWDVCSDQEAVDLVRDIKDPVAASKLLVDHALSRFSTDNLSCMCIRFDRDSLVLAQQNKDIGVEAADGPKGVSEVDKIVQDTKQRIAEGSAQAVGVSPSNSGRGHNPTSVTGTAEGAGTSFAPTQLDGAVVEEEGEAAATVTNPSKTAETADQKAGEEMGSDRGR